MPVISYFPDLVQGSEEWHSIRCGLITASEMRLILTPTLKPADNEKERAHLYELLAQRITGYVEPQYISDDMLRGHEDEIEARALYAKYYEPVSENGFITNDKFGFTLGYSPDGLVGEEGLLECKSRRQKYQIEVWCKHVTTGTIPAEHVLQVQTGLLVSERAWCDYLSYCGGLPMAVIRVYPDEKVQDAIVLAAGSFEGRLRSRREVYKLATEATQKLIWTERRERNEEILVV